MSNDTQNARFALKDARITRVKELPKVRFLSVICLAGKYPSFYDVTSFDDAHGRSVAIFPVCRSNATSSPRWNATTY